MLKTILAAPARMTTVAVVAFHGARPMVWTRQSSRQYSPAPKYSPSTMRCCRRTQIMVLVGPWLLFLRMRLMSDGNAWRRQIQSIRRWDWPMTRRNGRALMIDITPGAFSE